MSGLLKSIVPTLNALTTPKGLLFLGALGVISHRVYFIRGEHHLQAPLYLKTWVLSSIALITTVFLSETFELGYDGIQAGSDAARIFGLLNLSYFGPLFISIAIYRLFEHRLSHFDGPRLAAVTKIWHFWKILFTSNNELLDQLHHKYGRIIRTGPQELTIVDPNVWEAIAGPKTTCIKSPWYDMLHPYVAMNSIRTKEGYAPRRKRWDEALGLSAIYVPDKEIRIQHYATQLLRHIKASGTNPVNVTTWYHHFAFDFVGELAFGQSFGLTDDPSTTTATKELAEVPKLVSQGVGALRFFTPLPWIGQLSFTYAPYLPFVSRNWNKAMTWAAKTCDSRLARFADGKERNIEVISGQGDAFSRFIRQAARDNDLLSLDRHALYGDAYVITVAGSHTTALTLTMISYELARNPELQKKLREEVVASGAVRPHPDGDMLLEKLDVATIDKLPFLNGCINESLRLYPAVPTGGIKQTTDKSITVGDKVIPPQTVIVAPRWSIGRMESSFERANEFIPERWSTQPHLVKDARGLNGFGIGRHQCPGKQLGTTEIRMVLAMVVSNFSWAFTASEKNPTSVADQYLDSYTARAGALNLVFTPLA
ncbi:cytochrome P450 [Xylaria venustula]|nr:cytochrome P450 [Xylaria venustula]